jgi:NAD(P)H-dependent FMN reductase
LRGYPEHGDDTEIMTEVEKIDAAARRAGQEEVLTLLESYGYSEPPRLSGRGMAAMLRKRLAIIAQAKPVVQITPNRRYTMPAALGAPYDLSKPSLSYTPILHSFICPAQQAGISQERKALD